MKDIPQHIVKNVVLIGAGHAHVQVVKAFGMRPLPGVRLTVITRDMHTPYSGMLPGLIAGHYNFNDAHIDMRPLSRFANARLYQSSTTGIDITGKAVICDNRPPVPYDILSINIGSTPNTGLTPGAAEHAIPVKPIDGFLAHFEAMRERVLQRRGDSHIALIGAGAGGVELLLSLEYRLRRDVSAAGHDPGGLSFTLISASPRILPDFPARFQQRFLDILARRNIQLLTGAAVSRVDEDRLHFDSRPPISADEILWTTQAQPPDWLKATGLPLSDAGFIAVDERLCASGHENIFAAGDIITFAPRPLPKSGVYAVRAGPVLAENIRQRLTSRTLTRYRPQREAMYLISTGDHYAVGTRNGLVFAGEWVWRWKDWIDRRFMRKFSALPEGVSPDAPTSGPHD